MPECSCLSWQDPPPPPRRAPSEARWFVQDTHFRGPLVRAKTHAPTSKWTCPCTARMNVSTSNLCKQIKLYKIHIQIKFISKSHLSFQMSSNNKLYNLCKQLNILLLISILFVYTLFFIRSYLLNFNLLELYLLSFLFAYI